MKVRHLKTVERRKVSQPTKSTAPPPPLYRGWVVVVERAPPVAYLGGPRPDIASVEVVG